MQQANKQKAVSEQRLGKHIPAETNPHATIKERYFRCCPRQGVIMKTIKLASSGQAYDRSGDSSAVVAGDTNDRA
jgi:hypothetical protein